LSPLKSLEKRPISRSRSADECVRRARKKTVPISIRVAQRSDGDNAKNNNHRCVTVRRDVSSAAPTHKLSTHTFRAPKSDEACAAQWRARFGRMRMTTGVQEWGRA
jgi:hypothetical protein